MNSRMQTSQGVPVCTHSQQCVRGCAMPGEGVAKFVESHPLPLSPRTYVVCDDYSIVGLSLSRPIQVFSNDTSKFVRTVKSPISFFRAAHQACMNLAYSLFVGCPHLVSSRPLGRRNRMLLTLGMLLAISLTMPHVSH
jgi:hypothetical protein